MTIEQLYEQAVLLLKQLISIPSYSKYEEATADAIASFLEQHGIASNRNLNNVWAVNKYFDPAKPTILLNSHHDTVHPNKQYTKDPFEPAVENEKLYGLGSNDAGGCLVSLIAAFLHFYDHPNLSHNLLLAATAEEEISGYNGIEALLGNKDFKATMGDNEPAFAIVGEPTLMNLAVAEKGLMVLDCIAHGRAGHAAREEGDNALYKAMKDIEWFSSYKFEKISEWMGPVKMNVTVIETENKAHNIVPSQCRYVVDVRVTDAYTHEEVFGIISQHVQSEIRPRSMRLRSTAIDVTHPIVQAGIALGKTCYGSPTSSDKALMPFPSLKCGPGDSARSHTADEFIYLHEIKDGIEGYIKMLEKVL
ncbi:M20 family metallo-hydrolase [Aridibaculum aurantiacum]|uniref:M20 family metallo-hydrolase n=1 Tax=Aridibaculum aurantiacum TaxID=2810307 RepID=UPI001A965798|nr:M20 family metallo-hydrolase [Aridibaculum aurantiacum]